MVVAVSLAWFTRRSRRATGDDMPFVRRSAFLVAWLLATLAGTWLVDGEMKDRGANSYADELAGNGIYQFFAAYRNASLDTTASIAPCRPMSIGTGAQLASRRRTPRSCPRVASTATSTTRVPSAG
jgi:hypothetical protein